MMDLDNEPTCIGCQAGLCLRSAVVPAWWPIKDGVDGVFLLHPVAGRRHNDVEREREREKLFLYARKRR